MNPPTPQELREIAQQCTTLSKMAGVVPYPKSVRFYDLSAQALERWASDLERDADYARLKKMVIIERNLTPHTDKG